MTGKKQRDIYYIELIGKTLNVLEAFPNAPQRHLSLHEISEQLGMNKNTVFRILYSLAEHGYIVKDDRKYELGPKLMELSNARLRYTDLLTVAGPILHDLRERFGETVNLGILDADQIRYIGVWESRDRLRLAEKVGAVDMLHCSALGKAYMAYLPFEEVRALLGAKRLPAPTKNTITTLTALKAELETVRRKGYAQDAEESLLGAYCIATAILTPDEEHPVAAISVSGPVVRMNPERRAEVAAALKVIGAEIRAKLGA